MSYCPGRFLAGASGPSTAADGGREAGGNGRSGGSSKLSLGNPVLSSQRVNATSSTPVNPRCELRTREQVVGESAVISVTEMLSFCVTAYIQGNPAVLLVN